MPVFNRSRSYIVRILFIVAFLIMLAQLINLQVISGKYKQMAADNAILRKTVYPARGVVFDRKNRPMVKNVLMYDLMVTPAEIKGVDTLAICNLLDIDTAEFNKRIVTAIIKNGRGRPSAFESLLSPERYARLDENMWRFGNGFYLQERPVRTYPFHAGGHFMGYTGEVDSAIIARSDGFYQSGDYVGRTGLEASYEKVLMGHRGIQNLIKDNKNRIVGPYANGELDEPAIAGRGLHTYLDAELQQLAEKLLTNKIGAIVAIEPKTGGIIAMASGPGFNPDDLSGAAFKKTYARFALDVSKPLLNRVIKGQYPAGSTYKPIGALIGLDEGVITPRSGIGCSGAYYGCGRVYHCTEHGAGHAANLRLAIAHSCNSFFYNTFRLEVDNPRIGNTRKALQQWNEYCHSFGYGHKLGIDLPGEDGGNIPDTTYFNKLYRGSWNSCTMVSMGIGQGELTATPLQIANAMSIVANKGYFYTPHFVDKIEGETKDDTVLNKYRVQQKTPIHIPDSLYDIVIEGMHEVTVVGTAARIPKIPGINICAKTGTAQNSHNGVEQKDHSLFACFAPQENPKIAIAIIIENGGFGATWAGPMAYLMVEKYLTDSLRADRLKEVERIAAANLMPKWVGPDQAKEDSVRAFKWFELTKDSNRIRKYLFRRLPPVKRDSVPARPAPQQRIVLQRKDWIEPKEKLTLTKKNAA